MDSRSGWVRIGEHVVNIDAITYVDFSHSGVEVHFIGGHFLAVDDETDRDGVRDWLKHVRTAKALALSDD